MYEGVSLGDRVGSITTNAATEAATKTIARVRASIPKIIGGYPGVSGFGIGSTLRICRLTSFFIQTQNRMPITEKIRIPKHSPMNLAGLVAGSDSIATMTKEGMVQNAIAASSAPDSQKRRTFKR